MRRTKSTGIIVDIDTIKEYNVSEERLLQVKSDLWQFLRNVIADVLSKEISGT